MLFDTTFLMDLAREIRREQPGGATRFLERHPDDPVCVSLFTLGEFAEGFGAGERPAMEEFLRPMRVLPCGTETAWHYGQISRALRQAGTPIGDNDVWIAATAVDQKMALVTRNIERFSRVPDLMVVNY